MWHMAENGWMVGEAGHHCPRINLTSCYKTRSCLDLKKQKERRKEEKKKKQKLPLRVLNSK